MVASQSGLVVEIARAAQAYGADPAVVAPEPHAAPSGLAATVFAWLQRTAGPEMHGHREAVASDLQAQLAAYESYEASVLAGLNEHLRCIIAALGLDSFSEPLTAAALSHVCGRTLRDWEDSSL